jgi:hypothetical protein
VASLLVVVEVFTLDAAVLAALETATTNDPLYQKARAARDTAVAARALVDAADSSSSATASTTAAAAAPTATAAVQGGDRSGDDVLLREAAPVTESIYAGMYPAAFTDVLNW